MPRHVPWEQSYATWRGSAMTDGNPWGLPWKPMACDGSPWLAMAAHGLRWQPTASPTGCHGHCHSMPPKSQITCTKHCSTPSVVGDRGYGRLVLGPGKSSAMFREAFKVAGDFPEEIVSEHIKREGSIHPLRVITPVPLRDATPRNQRVLRSSSVRRGRHSMRSE